MSSLENHRLIKYIKETEDFIVPINPKLEAFSKKLRDEKIEVPNKVKVLDAEKIRNQNNLIRDLIGVKVKQDDIPIIDNRLLPTSPFKDKNLKPCPPGKIRNPKTGRCVLDPSKKRKPKADITDIINIFQTLK